VCEILGEVYRGYIAIDTVAKASVWCKFYPSEAVVALMVQSDIASSAFLALPTVLRRINASFVLDRVSPAGDSASVDTSVQINEQAACQSGQTTSPDGTSCVCGPGYSVSLATSLCAACAESYFSSTGVSCEKCPDGMRSAAAAAVCSAAAATRPWLWLAAVCLLFAR
jgi:hypothetical protein